MCIRDSPKRSRPAARPDLGPSWALLVSCWIVTAHTSCDGQEIAHNGPYQNQSKMQSISSSDHTLSCPYRDQMRSEFKWNVQIEFQGEASLQINSDPEHGLNSVEQKLLLMLLFCVVKKNTHTQILKVPRTQFF